jgi:DNA-binding MarR family transcriptional regulator
VDLKPNRRAVPPKKRSVAARHRRSPAGEAFSRLVLEVFRMNGQLLAAGTELTRDLGLTTARWQVIGAIAVSALTVPQIARTMGLTRQSVQRIVDLLACEGIVELVPNPRHRRAMLVRLTAAGRTKLNQISERQHVWANRMAEDLSPERLVELTETLRALRERLENDTRRLDGQSSD